MEQITGNPPYLSPPGIAVTVHCRRGCLTCRPRLWRPRRTGSPRWLHGRTKPATTKTSLRRSRRGGARTESREDLDVAGGVYAAKPRLALIVRNDILDARSSVIAAPMTSTLLDAHSRQRRRGTAFDGTRPRY